MSPNDDAPVTRADAAMTDAAADSLATRAPGSAAGQSTFPGSQAGANAPVAPPGLRFRVLRPHARGGLGEVHVAQDVELRREVALKQIQDHHADRQDSRSRFLLEAEITGGLEHPGIVPVYGLGQYPDGRPYYAMRFIRGDSLKEAIDRYHNTVLPNQDPSAQRLELRHLLGRLVDVCQAIAYAHSRGVLHRDLKPGNIMLGKYGETLVVDWGLAKPVDQTSESETGEPSLSLSAESSVAATQMGAVVGTPQFMSPEQAAGALAHMGPASDTYSLGATLYVLLTGKLPFADKDLNVILDKAKRGDFPRPRAVRRDIPKPLEAICLKAMALNPVDRYDSPLALAQDIEHWLADEPVSAWKEPWTVKAARWLRRHRTVASAVFTGVVATSIVLAVATVLLTAANERERRARELAVKNEQEAKKQRDIAENNYQLARAAVDRYHTDVSEEVLLHEPGMQELRKKLLGAAQEFYQKFAEARQHDVTARAELGRAYFRLGQITGEIESELKASGFHHKALQIFSQLPECEVDLAKTYHHLGRLQRVSDRLTDAQAHYEKAIALWKKQLEHKPDDNGLRAELARSLLGLGNVQQVARHSTEAAERYQDALQIRKQLCEQSPKSLQFQRDLAVSYSNLGMIYGQIREAKADTRAEECFQNARRLQEQLVLNRPGVSQYQDDLSRTDFNLGDLYYRNGRPKEARDAYRAAVDRWELLTRLHPAVLDFQTNLAEALGSTAMALVKMQDYDAAEIACTDALARRQKLADDHADVPSYRADLARGFLQLADLHRTAKNVNKAEKAYQTHIRIQQKLAEQYASVPHYSADLARAHNNLGLLYLGEHRHDDAGNAFATAEKLWENLHAQHAKTDEFAIGLSIASANLSQASRLAAKTEVAIEAGTRAVTAVAHLANGSGKQAACTAYWRRAEAFTAASDHRLALADWDAAVRLAAANERAWFNLYRLMTRARLGEHSAVTAEAEKLIDKAGKSGKALFCLACVFSLAADSASREVGGDAKMQQIIVDAYAGRAVALLMRSSAAGYFREQDNSALLSDEPALAFVRNRAEFRKLTATASD